jgi:hypothetical protein
LSSVSSGIASGKYAARGAGAESDVSRVLPTTPTIVCSGRVGSDFESLADRALSGRVVKEIDCCLETDDRLIAALSFDGIEEPAGDEREFVARGSSRRRR